jgi:hypothetical protein
LTPGSGIRDLGSGMGRKSASGSGMNHPDHIFKRLETVFLIFFVVKIHKFFDEDPGWRQFGSWTRDGDSSDPGSGMEKSRIRVGG